jgi:hypothetical protein
VAAPLTFVGLIIIEVSGIGLHYLAHFEEQQHHFFRWHTRDEDLRFVERGPESLHYGLRVERFAAHERPPLGCRVMGVPPDFSDQSFWREAGRLFDRGPDDSAERKDGVVRRDDVNKVTHFAAAGRCHDLIRGEVNRMQYVSEHFIPYRREEAVIAVNNPFKMRAVALPRNFGGTV